jgi:hypothetical protein
MGHRGAVASNVGGGRGKMAMDPEKVEYTISYLTGQVQGLLVASQVFASTSLDPQKPLSRWNEIEQVGLASVIDPTAIIGYQFALANVRTALEGAAAKERIGVETALGEGLGASFLIGVVLKALVSKKVFSDAEIADLIDQVILGLEGVQGTKEAPTKAVARARTMLESLLSSFSPSRPTT